MAYCTLYKREMIHFPDKETAIKACDELGIRFFCDSSGLPELKNCTCFWKEEDGSWIEKTEEQMHRDKNFV